MGLRLRVQAIFLLFAAALKNLAVPRFTRDFFASVSLEADPTAGLRIDGRALSSLGEEG